MTKKSFTRKDLFNKIYQKLGFSKNVSSQIIDDFFITFNRELIKTKKIKIPSFGTFQIAHKKERIGRNPKTKVEAIIPSRKVVKFKPSDIIKRKINNNEK